MPQTGLWHFRVHYEPRTPQEVVDFIKSKADMIIAVRETASRPHIHSVIVSFKQTKSTFIQQFLKEFPELKGNGQYSCSIKDDIDAQIRYCSKGESKETMPEILYCQESIDWKDYHEKYWEENSLLKAKSKNEYEVGPAPASESKKQKAKSKTWTEKVFDEIKNQFSIEIVTIQTFQLLYKPTELEIKTETDSRMVIFRYMMRCFGKAARKVSQRIVQEIFDGFINGIIQDHAEAGDKYSDRLFKSIYT